MNFPLASTDQKPAFGLGSAKALHAPLGAASPLWFAYAGAAGAGVAYWWMTRWMRPFNIEALIAVAQPVQIKGQAVEPVAASSLIEAVPTAVMDAPIEAAPVEETAIAEAFESIVVDLEPAIEPEPMATAEAVVEVAVVEAEAETFDPEPVVAAAPAEIAPAGVAPAEVAPKAAKRRKATVAKAAPARRG